MGLGGTGAGSEYQRSTVQAAAAASTGQGFQTLVRPTELEG
jgi:hypothetical protein